MILTEHEVKELEVLADKYDQLWPMPWPKGVFGIDLQFNDTILYFRIKHRKAAKLQGCRVQLSGFFNRLFTKEEYVPLDKDGPWWDDVRDGIAPLAKEIEEEITKRNLAKQAKFNKIKENYKCRS